MNNTNVVSIETQTPNTISASNAVFNVQALGQLTQFAELMAQSVVTVPKHLAGKPSDCMAIVMQAMQWGMNPYAVAQKTHIVNGTLGYEAQLVNAVISSSNVIVGKFKYEYGGDWEKIVGIPDKEKRDESGLFIRVGAVIRGELEISWGEPLYLADITTRNSPLWKTAPKQQIAYLGVKYWSRLFCPEVIMGVYTPEELDRQEKVVNPEPQKRVSLSDISGPATTAGARESTVNIDSIADEIRDRIEAINDVDSAKALRIDIESQKSTLGNTLFTELKGKSVKRYYLIDAKNRLEAEINSLPPAGEDGAVEAFAAVEKSLAGAKRHLTAELHDQFSITLADMKPEYTGA